MSDKIYSYHYYKYIISIDSVYMFIGYFILTYIFRNSQKYHHCNQKKIVLRMESMVKYRIVICFVSSNMGFKLQNLFLLLHVRINMSWILCVWEQLGPLVQHVVYQQNILNLFLNYLHRCKKNVLLWKILLLDWWVVLRYIDLIRLIYLPQH